MIRNAWRRVTRFLGSARVATLLLVIIGAWVMLSTLVPQRGVATSGQIASWASEHPALEAFVNAIGFHRAFTSPLLIGCVVLLALSTAVCAWQRTKYAASKARTLRRASVAEVGAVIERHDVEIDCGPDVSAEEILETAANTLGGLGFKVKRGDGIVRSVSSPWSAWGSPVFHWALLALILVVAFGQLSRTSGLMGVAVGQTKPDQPASYGVLRSGPLHRWDGVTRSIRVEKFEPDFETGGIDRGPTPTVSVLDGAGNVIKTQRVYPNMTLKSGSLTIYPDNYGLAAYVSIEDSSGAAVGRTVQLVDMSDSADGGTIPAGAVVMSDSSGQPAVRASVNVMFDRKADGAFDKTVSQRTKVRVVLKAPDGTALGEQTVAVGEPVPLPLGGALRVTRVDYYARLSLVDDGSIALIYAGLVVASIGLTVAVIARQQIVLAAVVETPEGRALAVSLRLWRNAPSSRNEIQTELAKALGVSEKGSLT